MAKTIYINASLLDGRNPAKAGGMVAVEGDRIAHVGASDSLTPGPRDQVVDLRGQTLMPGLVIGHYHGAYREYGAEGGSQDASAVEQAFIALSNAKIALGCGYTSVISAGTHYNIDAELAEVIDAGDEVGPRMISCGRNFMPAPDASMQMENQELCMAFGPDEFRRGALKDLDDGVQIIKIFASGGHGAPESRGMSVEEIQAVVEAARDYGARVRAHVAGRQKILDCVLNGVAIIDHADEADAECIEAFLEHGTFVLPSPYILKRAAELGGNTFGFSDKLDDFHQVCRNLPNLVDAGVKLVPGDDFGIWQIPHGTYAHELVCYAQDAGVAPLELIKWSTIYGAEMTRIPDLGGIETGKLADLLVVNGDPSADIGVLADPGNIQAVLKGGVLVGGALPEFRAAA